ncbi:MAG: M28 family peptidase [Flavobacteriales bacterium]|nr:M28 family peptidase [Flavobacteriales bacterium]
MPDIRSLFQNPRDKFEAKYYESTNNYLIIRTMILKHGIFIFALLGFFSSSSGQTNIFLTNPIAEQVLQGNYNPADYAATTILDDQSSIVCDVQSGISADSLKSYLLQLNAFQNRNTGSDTVSSTRGIGAARRWAFQKFGQFDANSEDRLIVTYLQFDQNICGAPQHRNMLAILPGADTSDGSIIIMEGHIDSRCEVGCDILCDAPGMEDNGSGTALVLELARVMSRYTFPNTMVFMLTIGEEQGLYGANAFAQYVYDNNIPVKAVQNNDVIGGILCGKTSSGPSCPFEGHIDSTNIRIFSEKSILQMQSRGYARFAKLVNDEKLVSISDVPMNINIIDQTDRTGRGGDHIPFSDAPRYYTAIRYCAANEHGDAGVSAPGYDDRQHTSSDVLGVDTDLDGELDSFYVDFNYLKRNCIQNAATATMASLGPEIPDFQLINDSNGLSVLITSATSYLNYRVGVSKQDQNMNFVGLYRFADTLAYSIPGLDSDSAYFITVASVDSNGITSLFSKSTFPPITPQVSTASAAQDDLPYSFSCSTVGIGEPQDVGKRKINVLCVPNPSSGKARIIVTMGEPEYADAYVVIHDVSGKAIYREPIGLSNPSNEVVFDGSKHAVGVYTYNLVVEGKVVKTGKLSLVE